MLTDGANATVGQVVDIIDGCLRVDQLDEILDNLDDVLLGQHADIHIGVETQFLVDAVTAYITQIVALVGEEQVLDGFAGTGIIGRIGIAQLAIDVEHSLLLGVTGVFGQGVEDDGIVLGRRLVLVDKNGVSTALQDVDHVLLGNLGLTIHDDLVTLDGHHLASILIDEVLVPTLQHTGGEFAADDLLQGGLAHLHLLGQVEDLQDVLIVLETDGTKQCRNRQLLLTVDVGIHHVVDVGGKLNPRTLERDDAGRVEQRAVGVDILSEEHAGRTMQLRHDHTLGTIDDERAIGSHIGNGTQEHVLNHRAEILMVGIRAVKFQLGLQGYAIGQAALQTLVDGVAGRVDIVVQELKNEIITRVGDREVLGEHLIQTVILAFLRRSVQLQEVSERLQLHIEEIR